MREAQDLEPARKALRESSVDEEGRGAKDHHAQRYFASGVFIPQSLDRLGPVRDLLDLVESENGSASTRPTRRDSGRFPLLRDPLAPAQRRFIRGGEDDVTPTLIENLPGECGLANLARSGDDLDESPRLFEALSQYLALGPLEHESLPFTQRTE
jgi:hypothetical protein